MSILTIIIFSLVFVLIAVLLILAIAMFHTASFAIIPEETEPLQITESDGKAMAEKLGRAVQIQTISFGEDAPVERTAFLSIHRLFENMFPRLHATLKREYINDYSLLYTWQGTKPELEPLMLTSHLDVVPIDPESQNEWTYPPFSGQIADGFVWGRGTMDIKNNVVGIMESVETLIKDGFQPERTLLLAFGHDEEIGGLNGAAKIAETLKERGVSLYCVLDEGGGVMEGVLPGVKSPVATVGVGEKGYLSLMMEAEGAGGHSSMPPAHTTIGYLSQAIERVEQSPFPADLTAVTSFVRYLGSELSFMNQFALANQWLMKNIVISQLSSAPTTNSFIRTTQAVTMVSGGLKDNILPREAKAVINFRLYPGDSLRYIYEHTIDAIGNLPVKIKPVRGETLEGVLGWEASPISSAETPQFQNLAKLIRQIFPGAIAGPYLVSGATDARYYAPICPAVFRFCPIHMEEGDLERMHGVNERLSLENCAKMVAFFTEFIKVMSGVELKD